MIENSINRFIGIQNPLVVMIENSIQRFIGKQNPLDKKLKRYSFQLESKSSVFITEDFHSVKRIEHTNSIPLIEVL